MKKLLIICLILGSISSTIAQKNINDYKYVIVPYKYDFVNEKDKYQLNSLSQFLFNKYGFEAIMEDADFPEDLIRNRCLALRSDVIKESGMFTTKLKVQLKDCNGDVIYTTKVGASREKQYKVAYNIAIREAFMDFETVNYKYQPNEAILAKAIVDSGEDSKEELQKLKEEINTLKQKQAEVKEIPEKKAAAEEKIEPKMKAVKEVNQVAKKEASEINILYAQKIENGYQLVDKTPKVVMIMLETNLENVFLVKNENAIVYKEDSFWYLSKNDGKQATVKTLNIKF
ncbi:hypothetical protein MWU58_05660 [Flavobacteriaceae bacterium S0825]|uniref:hypothetical protein n=1 Tax=Gaetbulibacter sp. S0825 TaxID=2720084 RepID=UPI001430F8CD|nr:hypothetical protein [Gaetbulibacter sp. S0825]MCK0108769.1 hypothetical protein [Flavobacteriaceae bacterium S0825]NIX64405.1 hypothetical protein [Gaetbulibacter sp. S0825]